MSASSLTPAAALAAPLGDVAAALRARVFSSRALVEASLAAIAASNPRLNAVLEVHAQRALARADAVDRAREAHAGSAPPLPPGSPGSPGSPGPLGPLAGVPIVVKDNLCLDHGKTTCASRMLADYRSPFTATCVRRLEEAGAIVVGKTNLDEFAMGGSGENSAFGPTRNPWDLARVPGGSSSGTAAAVAAGMAPAGVGSDTGGSIRQPAGFCGLVGIKPTYGRVSRWGLVAYASSLDQAGPMTRDVRSAALMLEAMSGHDALDSTSLPRPAPTLTAELPAEPPDAPTLAPLRVGVPRQARGLTGDARGGGGQTTRNHPAVDAALNDSIAALTRAGAEVVEVDLPSLDHAVGAYYVLATAEASSNLARYDGVRFGRRAEAARSVDQLMARSRTQGLGPEVRRRILMGTFVLSSGYAQAYYGTAQRVRRLVANEFAAALGRHGDGAAAHGGGGGGESGGARCDVLLMPTSPGPAFELGAKVDDPLTLYLEDVYTVAINLAGLPAVALPGGFAELPPSAPSSGPAHPSPRRLPVGVQIIGPPLGEAVMLRVALALERALGLAPHLRAPA